MVCWIALAVISCIAVHKWRGAKIEAKVDAKVRNIVKEELELENRKDSANVDAERDALFDGSVKSPRVFV